MRLGTHFSLNFTASHHFLVLAAPIRTKTLKKSFGVSGSRYGLTDRQSPRQINQP
jgi:hypothetical protein